MAVSIHTIPLFLFILPGIVSLSTNVLKRFTAYHHPSLIDRICNIRASNEVEELGCRTHSDEDAPLQESNDMTAVTCIIKCWDDRRSIALLKRGTDCFCDDSENGEDVPDENCNIRCPGAKMQICGGKEAASTFRTGYVALKETELTNQYEQIRAQFQKDETKRTPHMLKHDRKCVQMTPHGTITFSTRLLERKICVVHCINYRYVYAMMSNGVHCTCTSWMPDGDLHFVPGKCTKKCMGDHRQMCGGNADDIYSVFLTGYYKTTESLSQKSFRLVPALWQKWKAFLTAHQNVWKELLRKGIDLIPGEKPRGYEMFSTQEGKHMDAVVEEDIKTDDGLAMIVGVAVCGVVLLGAVLGVVVCCLRRSKDEAYKIKEEKYETSKLVESEDEKEDAKSTSSTSSLQRGSSLSLTPSSASSQIPSSASALQQENAS